MENQLDFRKDVSQITNTETGVTLLLKTGQIKQLTYDQAALAIGTMFCSKDQAKPEPAPLPVQPDPKPEPAPAKKAAKKTAAPKKETAVKKVAKKKAKE